MESVVSKGVFIQIFKEYEPQLAFFKPKKDQCSTCNIGETDPKYKDQCRQSKTIKKRQKRLSNGLCNFWFTTYTCVALRRRINFITSVNWVSWTSLFRILTVIVSVTYGIKPMVENVQKYCRYIQSCIYNDVKKIIFYADTCAAQNRNLYVVAALFYAINHADFCNIEPIDLKFRESEHSYLECDSIHFTIGKRGKIWL